MKLGINPLKGLLIHRTSSPGQRGVVIGMERDGKTTFLDQAFSMLRTEVVLEEAERSLLRRTFTYPEATDRASVPYTAASFDGDPGARLTVFDTDGKTLFDPREREADGRPRPIPLQTMVKGLDFVVVIVGPASLEPVPDGDPARSPERTFERQLSMILEMKTVNPDVMVAVVYTKRDSYPAFRGEEVCLLERPDERAAFTAFAASGRTDADWKVFLDAVTGPEGTGSLSGPARRAILDRSRRLWEGLAAMNHAYVRGYFVSALPCEDVGTDRVRTREEEDALGYARVLTDIRRHWKQVRACPALRPWMLAAGAAVALATLGLGVFRLTEAREVDRLNEAVGKIHKLDHSGLDVVAFDIGALAKAGVGRRPGIAAVGGDVVGRFMVLKRINGVYIRLIDRLAKTVSAPDDRAAAKAAAEAELADFRAWGERREGLLEREAVLLAKEGGDPALLHRLSRVRDDLESVVAVLDIAARPSFGPDDFDELNARLADARARLASRSFAVAGQPPARRSVWDRLAGQTLRPVLDALTSVHRDAYALFLRRHPRDEVAPLATVAMTTDNPYQFLSARWAPPASERRLSEVVASLDPPIDVVVTVARPGVAFEIDLLKRTVRTAEGSDNHLADSATGAAPLSLNDPEAIVTGLWIRPTRFGASAHVTPRRSGGGGPLPLASGLVALRAKLGGLVRGKRSPGEVALELTDWPSDVPTPLVDALIHHLRVLNPVEPDAIPAVGLRGNPGGRK